MKRRDVGGQAVIEGVMMRGSKSLATAVRTPKGNIEIDYKEKKLRSLVINVTKSLFIASKGYKYEN